MIVVGRLVRLLLRAVVIGMWLWLIPSMWFLFTPSGELAQWVAALAMAVVPPLAAWSVWRSQPGRIVVGGAVAIAYFSWLAIPASNEGNWEEEYARPVTAELVGDSITLRNVRDFEWTSETEYTPRYYDATYDLREIETLDFIKVHWGSPWIAHTMLSFGFRDGRHVTVSVETRRREGQEWSSVAGFFKQYTMAYVIGDERDLVYLRTNVRGEDVYVYPTTTAPEAIRFLFVDILDSATVLASDPEWYNTITDNCTTSLAKHIRKLSGRVARWDPRLLVNGHTDEMGIESGWIEPRGTLEETRAFYYASPRVASLPDIVDYSARLRAGS